MLQLLCSTTTIATHIIVTAKTDIVLFTHGNNLFGNPIDSSSTSSAGDKEVPEQAEDRAR